MVLTDTNFSNEDNIKKIESDYELPQSDISHAKRIEPYYYFFKLFGKKNEQLITLCLAAIKSLIRDTAGIFTREEMEETLSYLSQPTRSRVFNELQDYGWIINNGIRFEIPERVRTLTLFLYSALSLQERDFNQLIEMSCAMTYIDEIACTDEEASYANFEGAMGTLKNIRAQLKRTLEQKSPIAAREMLSKSKDIGVAFDKVEKRLKEWNRKKYQYTLTTDIRAICADIIHLNNNIFNFIHQDIQANAKSFGEYLTPEQIDEFLYKASPDLLAKLVKKRFSSPHKPFLLPKDEIMQRGIAYLQRKPEVQELTPPPPVVEIKQREVFIQRQENEAVEYYWELISQLSKDSELSVKAAVVEESFGKSLFRTGLLVTIRNEIEQDREKTKIDIVLDGKIDNVDEGPLDRISGGVVKLRQTI